MLSRLGRLWGVVRQILSVRSLLQWLGLWPTVTGAGFSAAGLVTAIVNGQSWPAAITVAAVAFTVAWTAAKMFEAAKSQGHGGKGGSAKVIGEGTARGGKGGDGGRGGIGGAGGDATVRGS